MRIVSFVSSMPYSVARFCTASSAATGGRSCLRAVLLMADPRQTHARRPWGRGLAWVTLAGVMVDTCRASRALCAAARGPGAPPARAPRVRLVESAIRPEAAESESRERQPAPVPGRLGARRLPGARRPHPRVLEDSRHLPQEPRGPRRRAPVRLLRGAADGQRPARRASHHLAHLQGPLPALQDDARLPRAAQGRLGHARPARGARGRAPPRHRRQAADRGLRRRRVQPAVPRERHRLPRGVGAVHRAHRLLARPRRRVLHVHQRLHRVGLVDPAADLGQGPALPGPQGRAVLPALRHRHQQPRGGAGLQGRHRGLHLRALPAHGGVGRAGDRRGGRRGERCAAATASPSPSRSPSGPPRRGRSSATSPRPSTRTSPTRSWRAAASASCSRATSWRRSSARRPRSCARSPAPSCWAWTTRRRSAS